MNGTKTIVRTSYLILTCFLLIKHSFAHNGRIGYAYPLGKIVVDGNLSDWPKDVQRYMINTIVSDTKPKSDADLSGYFQMGYSLANKSLYLAFVITDDDFIEDTSSSVRWNSQDALELYIDGRHLSSVSGVASWMYSKKLRNINKAYYDPFASKASWDMLEVSMVRQGNQRIYEWRINLENELVVGKSIGLDFNVFDLDSDKTFSYLSWGTGEAKFRNPNSLGDVVFLASKDQLGNVSGTIKCNSEVKESCPNKVRLNSKQDKNLWVTVDVDSTGKYSASLPAGTYEISVSNPYVQIQQKLYAISSKEKRTVKVAKRKIVEAKQFVISSFLAPDLIPDKGLLMNAVTVDGRAIDQFIETYQKYYNIPGVSFALIRDGKLVYHRTYGVKNTMTGQFVDDNTLFEAASVTKPVFAFAVERLAERGVIDLDKPLYEYLPYKDIEYDERYKLMTARHVLTHRTGFPNWRWMNPDGKLNLKFTPGTAYNYSGEGFEYLKMVIEKITGKKVEQVLKEEVIDTVGLYHTFFSRNDSLRKMVAEGHYDGMPNYDELPQSPGMAYSMHTEAIIFTRFMQYMLEQKGLSAAMYDSILTKHSDFDFGNEKPRYPAYMGMSLEVRETPFGKTFGHGGNNGDFKCHFEVYKDLKAGYVIFTNSNTSDPLLEVIRDFLFEGKDPSKK